MRFRSRFSLRLLLAAVTFIGVALGALKWRYDVDQSRLYKLGPYCFTASVDEVWAWTVHPHAFGAYRWIGPRWLEAPMRKLEIPWFDRLEVILIVADSNITSNNAAALAESAYIKRIEITHSEKPREIYDRLVEAAGNRIQIDFFGFDE